MRWLQKFMRDRNGMDELSMFLIFIALILSLSAYIFKFNIFNTVSTFFLILAYFRVFSKNRIKRSGENTKYLKMIDPVFKKIRQLKMRIETRKDFKYFKCNSCNQLVRVPKAKGRVTITCPKCSNKMIRRT